MKYRYLGGTGVKVSTLCLGTLMLSSWGRNSPDESVAVIERALDAGINYIDTADSYAGGESEEIVGKALAKSGKRDRVVLATKVFWNMSVDPNARGLSRRWIVHEVEQSLRRLGTDHIDLYQVHRPDPNTDIEETLEALSDLVTAGKVRYIGTSNFPAHRIVEAQWAASASGLRRFVSEQPQYSVLAREAEADVLPTCRKHRLGVTTWSPLAGGWLTGRHRADGVQGATPRAGRWPKRYDPAVPANQRKLAAVEQLALLAEESGITLVELALAFALNHPDVTSVAVGPRTREQLESQLKAPHITLPEEVLDRIDEIVPPGEMLVSREDGSWIPPELTDPALRRRTG
ncbi:aldo/keto reductase [Streptomyces morookaense]|uniref:Aldo/keto reductase n=1 Tax=Streptomyces morookaense TaxID=1970 RepID=A0A7Y7B1U1_STRMO|nr:aldo/keto reductase [Streptomyces morookaense]NVK77289.1 aldo/keto reductase [Streptomyces morookaense]GHF18092.1 aldo/keto reductase [Streptomyces morookaense]